jgi:gas vesicle protein
MSLKEFTKEVFTKYGLTDEEINVYLKYLGVPMCTMSEAYMYYGEGEIEFSKVEEITQKLVENNFLKKVEGIVDRYIPLEPYFELFTDQSEVFRQEIASTKDGVLSDQSNRFEKLESIQNKSLTEIETAVSTQVKDFFDDSDQKNADKKARIDKATNRFTDTSKTLEKELHDNVEKDYTELTNDLTQLDTEFHQIVDTLISDNESAINTAKTNIDKIITDLLGDFSTRVSNLETELKKDLDGHVDRHKNIANELKPKMEQILEKYLERMDKIITDLKERISRLLADHMNHVKSTTGSLESDMHTKVENRHLELKDIVNSYKNRALTLLENLITQSNRFSDLAEGIATTGFFFGKSKKQKYINAWKVVENEVANISRPFKDDFVNECNKYITDTQGTSDDLKKEVSDTVKKGSI